MSEDRDIEKMIDDKVYEQNVLGRKASKIVLSEDAYWLLNGKAVDSFNKGQMITSVGAYAVTSYRGMEITRLDIPGFVVLVG